MQILALYFLTVANGNDFGFGIELPPYDVDEITPLEEYVHRPDPYFSYDREPSCEEHTVQYSEFVLP